MVSGIDPTSPTESSTWTWWFIPTVVAWNVSRLLWNPSASARRRDKGKESLHLYGVRGTVSADRWIGTQKKELLKESLRQKTKGTTVSYILMVQIEKVFDPYNIFNPGKMV